MRWLRKFVTSTVAFTFVVVGVTGVIFRFWFKNHTLEDIHGWVGVWMVAAAIFHIVQNWHSMAKHLKNPRVYLMALPVVAIILAFGLHKEEERGPNPRRVIRKLIDAKAGDVAHTLGKDMNDVCTAMKNDGLAACAANETLAQLADRNHQQPERVLGYFAM